MRRFASAALLAVWIIPLGVQAGEETSVDIDEALGAVVPEAGFGERASPQGGGAPMPRVCARFAHQIASSMALAERAAAVDDATLEERMRGQIALVERRAAPRCPQLDALVDAAVDPKAIASSQICVRYAFQIAHYENMAERADSFRGQLGDERANQWREQTLAHSRKLRDVATPVCPELEQDAVKKAKEFAKLMKLAARAALSYLTMGASPF